MPQSPIDPVGFGLMLPSFDPLGRGTPPLLEAARLAERAGFDSAFVGDHLRGHCPVIEATTALAAAAGTTSRIRLGFAVMLLAMRQLAWTAKAIASIEALAPGRLVLGVGVGGEYPWEWETAGVPVKQRGARTDEALPLLAALLRGERVEHSGPHLELTTEPLAPVPGQMPPLMIGGRSERAMLRAVEHGDAWLPVWLSAKRLTERVGYLHELCARSGRSPLAVPMMVFCCVTDDVARARRNAGAYLSGQYKIDLETAERWCPIGDADHVAQALNGFLDAGATGLILVPFTDDPLAQIEPLAQLRERLPALAGHDRQFTVQERPGDQHADA